MQNLVWKILMIQHALVRFVRLFHHQSFTLYGNTCTHTHTDGYTCTHIHTCMHTHVTVWDIFTYKLKFILLPQLITTLNKYACWLLSLANVDWSAFPECFLLTLWIHDWWNGTNEGLQFGSWDLIWLPLSVHVCLGFVVEYWPFVGTCGHHNHSKLYDLCLLASML